MQPWPLENWPLRMYFMKCWLTVLSGCITQEHGWFFCVVQWNGYFCCLTSKCVDLLGKLPKLGKDTLRCWGYSFLVRKNTLVAFTHDICFLGALFAQNVSDLLNGIFPKGLPMGRFFPTFSPPWNNKSILVFPRQARAWRKNLPIQCAQGHQPVRLVVVFWWLVVFPWWWCVMCDVMRWAVTWCDPMWWHVIWCEVMHWEDVMWLVLRSCDVTDVVIWRYGDL